MNDLFSVSALISLITLTVMEMVLGIDNVIFISIVSGKLPREEQGRARTIGMSLALIIRIGLLTVISWIKDQQQDLFHIGKHNFSVRDLILIGGGLFLLTKSTREIHEKLEGDENHVEVKKLSLSSAIIQIVLLDVVFSFDSILTAIGIADQIAIMITAVIISLGIMLAYSAKVSAFVNKHPTVKMLALSFLLMIGMLLILDGMRVEVEKTYLYFAMAFSFFVEVLNMQARKKDASRPLRLKNPKLKDLENDVYEDKNHDDSISTL